MKSGGGCPCIAERRGNPPCCRLSSSVFVGPSRGLCQDPACAGRLGKVAACICRRALRRMWATPNWRRAMRAGLVPAPLSHLCVRLRRDKALLLSFTKVTEDQAVVLARRLAAALVG